MLDPDKLQDQFKQTLENSLLPALEQALTQQFVNAGETEKNAVKLFIDTLSSLCLEQLSKGLANAIDTYIRNIEIYGTLLVPPGTIITLGNKFTQTQGPPGMFKVTPNPTPAFNGTIPGSLGVK